MARARNIKPSFFHNDVLVELSFETRLLFIGLWTLADREGRIEYRPKKIKMEIFPADDINVADSLTQLAANGFLKIYEANNVKVIQVMNFEKHQSPHGTEKDSDLPCANGLYTVNQRKNNLVTGKPSFVRAVNNVNQNIDNKEIIVNTVKEPLSNVNLPSDNALIPESLFLNPDLLNPDSPPSMTGNKNKNASEEKTEGNLYVVPSRRTYEMFIGWKPEPVSWAVTLQVSQHLVKPEQFTDYTLAEFIRSNVGKDEKTENDWQRFYVNAVARGYVKPMTENQQATQQPKQSKQRQQQQHDEYIPIPLYVPKPRVENPATPEQIKEIMDEMRRKIAGGE